MSTKKKSITLILAATFLTMPLAEVKASSDYISESTETYEKLNDANIYEDDYIRKSTFHDNISGKEQYFIYYKNENKVYSSITDQYVQLSKDFDSDSYTRSKKSSVKTKYISYKSIKSLIGNSTDVVTVGSAIATLCGITPAAGIGAISTLLSKIGKSLPNQSNHGIKVVYNEVKYYRHGNKVAYRTVHLLKSASLY